MATTFCMTGSPAHLFGGSLRGLLVSQRFGMSARKAENGFVGKKIVSSRRSRRNSTVKNTSKFRGPAALRQSKGGTGRNVRATQSDCANQALSPTGENR